MTASLFHLPKVDINPGQFSEKAEKFHARVGYLPAHVVDWPMSHVRECFELDNLTPHARAARYDYVTKSGIMLHTDYSGQLSAEVAIFLVAHAACLHGLGCGAKQTHSHGA